MKSLYKNRTFSYGLGIGHAFENGGKVEGGLAWREYESKVNTLEADISLYEMNGNIKQVLSRIPDWFDFYIGVGIKWVIFETSIEDEVDDTRSSDRRHLSFAYQYEFGIERPIPVLASAVRFSVAKEHIYKALFGNFSLDGHLYRVSWTLDLN